MSTKVPRIISILILLTFIFSACTGGNTVQTTVKPPLEVGWSLFPGWYPLVIAEKQGFFEKYNVQVKLTLYDEYKQTTPALASGMIDGAALVLGDTLLQDVAEDVKIVLVTDNSHGADQLIASPAISGPEDLRGKRVGVVPGTFGGLLVSEMLSAYDMSLADIELVNVPPEQVPSALPEIIDVGHTYEPFASEARANGNISIFSSADAPGLIVDTISFRKTVIEERPEDIRNFINAWFDAVAYWQANPDTGNAIIAEATGQNVADVNFDGIRFFDRQANQATFRPGNDRSSIVFTAQFDMDYLINSGLVTQPVNVDEVLDASFLK